MNREDQQMIIMMAAHGPGLWSTLISDGTTQAQVLKSHPTVCTPKRLLPLAATVVAAVAFLDIFLMLAHEGFRGLPYIQVPGFC